MGIARTAAAADAGDTAPLEPVGAEMMFGGDAFVETAVFASRQADDRAVGAPGFRNAADTDPSLPGEPCLEQRHPGPHRRVHRG